jgi:hypothetical protein
MRSPARARQGEGALFTAPDKNLSTAPRLACAAVRRPAFRAAA